jgi:hypothetical protein
MRRLLILVAILAACTRRDPPAWDGGSPSEVKLSKDDGPAAAASARSDAAPPPTDAGAPSSGTLLATDGAEPQTKDRPKADSEKLRGRMRLLFEAIVKDEPDLALPAFFPKEAYEQVKAIPNPAGDWKRRLVAAFNRDIHALHKELGDGAGTALFVGADIPEARGRWVDVDEETNKIGYYRVYGTKLQYRIGESERVRAFDVKSLISWRGEWYVVHLSGFK